jgi:hypothetical protein
MSLQKYLLLSLLVVSCLKDCVTQEITPDCLEISEKCSLCGKLWYDPTTQLCCAGVIYVKKSSIDQCCGKIPYNSNEILCCNGKLIKKKTPYDQ